MNKRKHLSVPVGFLLVAVFCVPFMLASKTNSTHHSGNSGTIKIQGSSNVNQFELKNTMMPITIRACGHSRDTVALRAKNYWLKIPVKSFQSDNQQIYKDFLTLTKANQHPNISVGISYEMLHRIVSGGSMINVPAEVSIAGVSRAYQIRCQMKNNDPQTIVVTGNQKMKLTDFNISPPEKLFGLIKVNNEINVTFGFVITII